MSRRKICFKFLFVILTLCMLIASFPLTTAFADKLIPAKYFGTYDCETNPSGVLILISEDTISFRGRYDNYGSIAAAYPSTVYFDPLLTNAGDNFNCIFGQWSKLVNGQYEPRQGTLSFFAYYNKDTSKFRVYTGSDYEYYAKG